MVESLEERQLLATFTGTGGPIADNATTNFNLNVTDSMVIGDLNVTLDILHTRDADLDVFLRSPSGSLVELFTDVGGGGDDFSGTTLDDEASTSITAGSAPFSGTFRPEGNLSDFDGEDVNGNWTLEITDDRRRQTGELIGWQMDVTPLGPPEVSINDVQVVEGDDAVAPLKIASDTNGGPTLADGASFGHAVASIGDLDKDGIGDMAVGHSDDTIGTDRGVVDVLFMKADGTVRSSTRLESGMNGLPTLSDFDAFGASVDSLGDLNGDGTIDLVVGASQWDPSQSIGPGFVYVLFMNEDGIVQDYSKIGNGEGGLPPGLFAVGDSVGGVSLGDLDKDGTNDIVIGAYQTDTGGPDRGAIYILFMNDDGTVRQYNKIADGTDTDLSGELALNDWDGFGRSATSLGDLDGDGVIDLAVGSRGDDTGGPSRGAVHVLFLKSDGTVKSFTKIASDTGGGPTLQDNGHFGISVASLGDVDGDGATDLAVGSHLNDTGGESRGSVHVLFLNDDGTAKSSTKIASDTGGGPRLADGDRFGISAASLGDRDGDGIAELAVGARADDTGGQGRGAVYLLNLTADGTAKGKTANFTVTRSGDTSGTSSVNFSTANGTATAGSDYVATSGTVVFLPGDTTRTISVNIIGDTSMEPNEDFVVTLTNATGATISDGQGEATISDDDIPGITVSPTSGLVTSEDLASDSFTVRLDTEPTADVTVAVSSSDTTEGTVSAASLTFTPANWSVPQSIIVTGVDDADEDGDIGYTIITAPATSADPAYNGFDAADVAVTNIDNEAPSVVDDYAIGNSNVSGTVSGSLANTYANNEPTNTYQAITEELYAGNKRSRMEHQWEFDVTGGSSVTFFVEAYHDSTTEGFEFAYSLDGGQTWVTMDTVSVSNTESVQSYVLPSGISGTVLVRVQDTDRSRNETTLDTLFIDEIFIRSES